jgi:hypothetical protein
MRTGQATLSRQHQSDLERIQKLEYQLQAYRLNVQKAQDKIHRLTAEIRQTMQDVSNLDSSQSPAECMYLDIVKTIDAIPTDVGIPSMLSSGPRRFMLFLLRPLTLFAECFPFQVNLFSILGLYAIIDSSLVLFRTTVESGR